MTVTDSNNNVLGTVTIPADDTSAAINVDTPLEAGTVLTSAVRTAKQVMYLIESR